MNSAVAGSDEIERLREALQIARNVLVKYAEGFQHDADECRGFIKELDDVLEVIESS